MGSYWRVSAISRIVTILLKFNEVRTKLIFDTFDHVDMNLCDKTSNYCSLQSIEKWKWKWSSVTPCCVLNQSKTIQMVLKSLNLMLEVHY